MLRRWLRRLRNVVRRRMLEREIDEEMRLHVALEAEERVRAGASPVEARRGALVAFGGLERQREAGVDARDPSAG